MAQSEVMRSATLDYTTSARPADGPGEDHASDLYLRNLDQLWPDWRRPDHTKLIRVDGSHNRLEPWPTDPTQLMRWLVTSDAEPWVPRLDELDALRRHRIARNSKLPKVIPATRKKLARVV